MKEPNFTFIIPHYNIPDLLVRCIQSIPVREDVQVIVADDCSPDSEHYKEKYPELSRPYLEFYSTSHGGSAGRARNVGLEHARGQWLLFADADDFFYPCIEEVLLHLETSKADIVYFDVKSYNTEQQAETNEAENFNEEIAKALQSGKTDSIRFHYDVPWGKAIRHSVVKQNHIRFEETYCSNDSRFAAVLGHYAQTIEVLPEKAYCWVTRENSLWRNRDVNWYTTRIKVHLGIVQFLLSHQEPEAAKIHTEYATRFLFKLEKISFWNYIPCAFRYGIVMHKYAFILGHLPKQILLHLLKH